MPTDTPQPGEREGLQPGDIAAARALVDDLCKRGDSAWRMCIPPQPDDSDMLLTRVIDAAERAARELAEARAEVERLRAVLAERGEHADDCGAHYHGYEPSPLAITGGCTCGLSAALAPAQERERYLAAHPYTGGVVAVPHEGVPFAATDVSDCSCRACLDGREQDLEPWKRTTATRMIVCPECGNKRCPLADSHRYACTGSNELGQVGVPIAPEQERQ